MNERQWEIICLFMESTTRLLEAIEKNTRPEVIEEPKTSIKGFGVEKTK